MKIRKQKKESKKKHALIVKQNEHFKDNLKQQLQTPTFTILKQ